MRRREFLGALGGAAAAWPVVARAQQSSTMRRVAVLMAFAEGDAEGSARLAALLQRLKELGWEDGRNLRIDYRWTGGDVSRMSVAAKELCNLRPDLIVATTIPATIALKRETNSIPIIFLQVSDPIGSGLVTNLPRPETNVTGFTNFEFSIGGKWLQLIKEMVPSVSRVSVMFNPKTAPYADAYFRSVEAAGPTMSISSAMLPVPDVDGIETAIANLAASPNSALIVLTDIFTTNNRNTITKMAAKYRMPAVYPFKFFTADGGLMSYGIDNIDMYRRAATYVDRLLKGTAVADLPVQQPTKYELVINLKTAKALGLEVPQMLLTQADEVIE